MCVWAAARSSRPAMGKERRREAEGAKVRGAKDDGVTSASALLHPPCISRLMHGRPRPSDWPSSPCGAPVSLRANPTSTDSGVGALGPLARCCSTAPGRRQLRSHGAVDSSSPPWRSKCQVPRAKGRDGLTPVNGPCSARLPRASGPAGNCRANSLPDRQRERGASRGVTHGFASAIHLDSRIRP